MKIFLLALAAGVAGFAQAPPSRLVRLNVAATDNQGKRVTDLTAAELQVTDQGKAVAITALRNAASRPAVAASAAHEFTNSPPPALRNPTVVLFDLLGMPENSRQTTLDQTVRALEHLEAPESVYLYVISLLGELVPVHAIPDGPPAQPAHPWTTDARALLEHAVGPVAAREVPMRRDIMRRIEVTYAAFEMLAGRLEPLPGRKNLLWLTSGLPCVLQTATTPWDCRPNLSRTAGKMAQAGVALNPVVLENLGNPEVTSTFQQFTDFTGGKVYPTADIEKAVGDSIEVNRSCYLLEFAPPANGWDGKLHKVRVTSTRKGINLQTTQAYSADKATVASDEKERNVALFRSAFDAADIPVSVITSPAAQPKTLHLRINLDPRDLQLTPQGEGVALNLTLYVAAYLPDDRMQPYAPTPVNATLNADQLAKMTRDGIHLGNDVLIPDGVRKIRLLVVDRSSNRAGTVTIPIG